jgi:glycosyltransferase involved in cell wall biosynthesis
VRYSELEYARFCRSFEKQLTDTILRSDPKFTCVLSNDVSEGPDFALLATRGYPLFTIYHVDVVEYFAAIYLRGLVKAETTTAFFRTLRRLGMSTLVPKMLNLIWPKQEASVRHSSGLIVPSSRMKEVLIREYPGVDPGKIHVLPWGTWDNSASAEEVAQEKAAIQASYPSVPGDWNLLMLSRISPEKGQDRLLKALWLLEKDPDFPAEKVNVFISGEAAYMMGQRFEKELKRLSARLKRCRTHFVGYAAPARKKALFEISDLYVFPSRHESYGLTLLEALREGCPVLSTPSHGACEVFQPEFGEMTLSSQERNVPELLAESLRRLLSDRPRLKAKGAAGAKWAAHQSFSATASRLTELLISQ